MRVTTIKQWLQAAADVVMPRSCPVCGKTLSLSEPWLCHNSLNQLPRTFLYGTQSNAMEQLFYGKTLQPIEMAAGLFWYEKSSSYATILHDIKYHHMPRMGQWLAQLAMSEMPELASNKSVVVPVPLHATKLAQRGYNQSEYIARGVAQATGASMLNALEALHSHSTQTHKSALERWENIQGTYSLKHDMKQRLVGKHIVVVDDVVTTGSTLEACINELQGVPQVTVSVFTLAVARLS